MMFGLPEQTRLKMAHVFASHPEIEQVIIYGSRAKGNFRPGSDIDITLSGRGLTDSLLSEVATELDDLNTPYMIDISIYEQLQSNDLRQHIKNVGKVFYQRHKPGVSGDPDPAAQ